MFASIQFPNIENYLFRLPAFDFMGHHLGPFPLRWYALAYIAGLIIGWRYMVRLTQDESLWRDGQKRIDGGQCDDFLFWATLGVILGGRIGFVLFYMLPSPDQRDIIAHNPFAVLQIWNGGMSFHGGLIGVALAIFFFARRNAIPLLTLGDIVAACAPIGLFFGRLANFVNGELWGRPTDAPWGMVFCTPIIRRDNGGICPAGEMARHPSQLYEASLEGLALFLILWWATHKLKSFQRPGLTIALFLFCYGLFRFSLENVRQPDVTMPLFPFGITMGMMLSAPMMIAGLALAAFAWTGRTAPPAKA
jgi:phosphatidylglycerol:prolipoprotein diacylglycerol transferase